MDYLIAPGPGDRGTSGPGQRTNGGGGPDPATTINGVVINVNGSNSPALSQTPTSSGTTPAKAKPVKKIRRDASFRQLFHSKSSAPKVPPVSANSTPVPPTSSVSNGYHGTATVPSPASNMQVKKTFSTSSTTAANIINAGSGMSGSETYKSLGDVFGINAAVNGLITSTDAANKNISSSTVLRNGDTAVYRVNSGQIRSHASNRNSTYSNVSTSTAPSVGLGGRFGSQESRASYNGHHQGPHPFYAGSNGMVGGGDPYKSNSSLDLDSEVEIVQQAVAGASFFGPPPGATSNSSDVMRSFEAGIEASAAATSTLQRKPNNNNGHSNLLPAAYGVTGGHLDHSSGSGHVVMSGHSHPGQSSPKLKKKGFFSSSQPSSSHHGKEEKHSMFKKLGRSLDKSSKSTVSNDSDSVISVNASSNTSGSELKNSSSAASSGGNSQSAASRLDDRHRRRFFSHHDVCSMCSTLQPIDKATSTGTSSNTGASAACAALKGAGDNQDQGDNVSNDLVLSCPHFRNEVGGEGERLIALSRSNNPNAHSTTPSNGYNGNHHASNSSGHHGLHHHHHHGMAKRRSSSSSSSDGVSTSSSSGLSGTPPGVHAGPSSYAAAAAAVALGQLHPPNASRGFGLFSCQDGNDVNSSGNGTFWRNGYCPYRKSNSSNTVERLDQGATFYKKYFYGQDHQNWFGIDANLGPLAVSLRREKVPSSVNSSSTCQQQQFNRVPPGGLLPVNTPTPSSSSALDPFLRTSTPGLLPDALPEVSGTPAAVYQPLSSRDVYMYRIIVRTSDLLPLRGCVLEESIPALGKSSEKVKSVPTKEVLEFVLPEIQLSSLRLGVQSGPCEKQLIRLDEEYVRNTYKVGMLYCRDGQQTEEDMYNNEEGGPAFNEFLDLIGQRVRLKGFNRYKAGLCNKDDTTGEYSVYTEDSRGNEIMFHVSTLLPFTPNNRQQLPRKRYIGNDIVTVVFQEPGAMPFIPKLKSQFQHVFIVVRVHNPCSDSTTYSVAVTRSKSVPMFGPAIPKGAVFTKSKSFADWLLTKIVNAEIASTSKSEKFVSMATRTRQGLLQDLATNSNYVTQTTIDSGSKFNIFASKRKDKLRPRFSPDSCGLGGALSWRVVAEDCSSKTEVEAFIGISPDSVIVVQDNCHHDTLFLTASKSIIGWTALPNSIRIYFHMGEALILHSKDWESEDMSEIAQRLKAVTSGAATQEFVLRRNQVGQLGFHVQHDGLITEVENFGYAWQSGLRQGSRLVEICKHPVTGLTHEQMVELLKTSMTVTVTVIPPFPDGQPRKGCHLINCSHPAYGSTADAVVNSVGNGANHCVGGALNEAGDYENFSSSSPDEAEIGGGVQSSVLPSRVVTRQLPSQQQPVANSTVIHQTLHPNSPPRSSNSSGYGTGSSRKSFTSNDHHRMITIGGGGGISKTTSTLINNNNNNCSSDENRWYEEDGGSATLKEENGSSQEGSSPAPPLPNRIGSGKLSAFQPVASSSGSNNLNSSNSSSPSGNGSGIYQHPPPPRHLAAGPATSGNNFTTHYSVQPSVTPPIMFSSQSHHQPNQSAEKRSTEAKVTYLTEFELNRARGSNGNDGDLQSTSFLQHERLHALKPSNNSSSGQSKKKKSTYIVDGGHTTDSSSSSEKAVVSTPPPAPHPHHAPSSHKRTPVEEQHYQRLTQQRKNYHNHLSHFHHQHVSNSGYHVRSEDELSAVSVGSLGMGGGSSHGGGHGGSGGGHTSSPRQRRRRSSRTSVGSAAAAVQGSGHNGGTYGTGTRASLGLAPSSSTNHLNTMSGFGAKYGHNSSGVSPFLDDPVAGAPPTLRKRSSRHHPNRNSTTFSTVSSSGSGHGGVNGGSTFQEDLMRLIGPDSSLDKGVAGKAPGGGGVQGYHPASRGSTPSSQQQLSATVGREKQPRSSLFKSRSRENIASSAGLSETSFSSSANTTLTPDTSGNAGNSSSGSTYHTARPATVVSGGGGSNNSSVLQVHSSSNNSSLNNSASSNSQQQGINRTTSVPTPLGNNPVMTSSSKIKETNYGFVGVPSQHHQKLSASNSNESSGPAPVASESKALTPASQQQPRNHHQHIHRPLARNSPSIPAGAASEPTVAPGTRLDWSALVNTASKAGGDNSENIYGGGGAQQLKSGTQENAPAPKSIQALQNQLARSTAALRNLSPTSMAAAAEAFAASQMAAAAGGDPASGTSGGASSTPKTSPEQLMTLVSSLESKLNTETVEKSNLEDQIALLKEENARLQEESQSAANQLRRFTEWFFQTMENNANGHDE